MQPDPILREPVVTATAGVSHSTLWAKIKNGLYTKPVHIGPRAVGWPSSEVAALNRAIIAGRSNDEIKELVQRLEAERVAKGDV